MSSRVWFDAARERFWRVPAHAEIPPGTETIRSLTGGRIYADTAAMGEWLLERQDARRAVRQELQEAATHASRALGAAAQDVWMQAAGSLPDAPWEDLEARLGPMETWIDADALQDRWRTGKEQVERTTKNARATLKRASRVAGSAARSARAFGKVVLENPELAEQASKWAEALSQSSREPRGPRPRRRRRDDTPDD